MATIFSFPGSPSVGALSTLTNGTVARFDGSTWVSLPQGLHTTASTAPSTPSEGDRWWDSATGVYSVRMEGAWVEVGGGLSVSGGSFNGAVRTVPVNVSFSATPTLDATLSNVFLIGALTGNITLLTLANGIDGQTVNIRLVEDATGGRSVALAANIKASGGLTTTASSVTWLVLTYVGSANRWEGAYSAVPA